MEKKFKTMLKAVVFLLPFAVGTLGFYEVMRPGLLNAMYASMRLYLIEMDCAPSEVNFLIEIARWTAPLMTVTALFVVLNRILVKMRIWVQVKNRRTVAIHGDSTYVAALADSLGKRAVVSEFDVARKAANQVLMFRDDPAMLAYLNENKASLFAKDRKVYLCSEELVRGNFRNRNLIFCNFPENCACQYWKNHPLSVEKKRQDIVIVGTGNYGREILAQALLTNVFSPDHCTCYHVFGDSAQFRGLHTQLAQFLDIGEPTGTRDCLCFYDTDWWERSELVAAADRVILTDDSDEKNLVQLSAIRKFFPAGAVHIKMSDASLLEELWPNVTAFGTAESLCTAEYVLNEARFELAKQIHTTYFGNHQCGARDTCAKRGNCADCELAAESWNQLSNFVRYSNVAQADHIQVKIQLLLGDGFREISTPGDAAKAQFEKLTPEEKNVLFETEHERWCRYHYMNNWSYAPIRDNAKRRHPLLVPYTELVKQEEQKDEDTWYTAFALFQNQK